MPRRAIILGNLNKTEDLQKLRQILQDLYERVDMPPYGPLQTLAAGTTILPSSRAVPVVGSGGAVTITADPSIADGYQGQLLILEGTDNTNTVTLTDGLGMQLGAGTRVLGANDTLTLMFNGTDWLEVAFTNA